jgi:hypothetical protein
MVKMWRVSQLASSTQDPGGSELRTVAVVEKPTSTGTLVFIQKVTPLALLPS